MPSLSFDKRVGAKPIAVVKGGEEEGEVLYLHDDDFKGKKPTTSVDAKYVKGLKVKPIERTRILAKLDEAKRKGWTEEQLGESEEVADIYRKILSDDSRDTSVSLTDGSMFQVLPSPDPEKREVFYIAGASGSGKSYFAKGFADCYKKLFPKREVYLVSKLEKDETLDSLKFIKRINIKSFVEDYPSLEEFNECCVIFDDYDTLQGEEGKVVQQIIDDLAIQGRHTKTTMLCLSHYLTRYKQTRLILNEATHIVVYPAATAYHPMKYLLKNYVGVEEDDIKAMRKWGSRWLCFMKNYPQVVVSQQRAKLLHAD